MRRAAPRAAWAAGRGGPIRVPVRAVATRRSASGKPERGAERAGGRGAGGGGGRRGGRRLCRGGGEGTLRPSGTWPVADGLRAARPDAGDRSIGTAARRAGLLALGS